MTFVLFTLPDLSTLFMFVGFLLAAWAVTSNDSIQTLGTFLSSNKSIKWYWLFAVSSLVLIITISWGWYVNSGDVAWGRLQHIPQPTVFTIWHVIAPLTLLILTRFGIPVSTTFLVLSAFATNRVMAGMVLQSVLGYAISFAIAYAVWRILPRIFNEIEPVKKQLHHTYWRVGQWLATMFLWSQWLIHDMANIMVYLPRQLSFGELIMSLLLLTFFLGVIFFKKGGKIQKIVLEKTNTQYVRSATLIDIVFALILVVLKQMYSLPLSTTWVFVGLLAGRELAMHHVYKKDIDAGTIFPMLFSDFLKVLAGLCISVIIALIVTATH